MRRLGLVLIFSMILLTTTPAHAWLASLGFFKSPQGLDKSWTPHWSSLLAYWAFENNWNDSSGNGNTGVVSGSPSFSSTNPKEGTYSAYFPGNSVVVPAANFLTATYTKVAWINMASGSGSYSNNIVSGGGNSQHAFWTNGCGSLQLSGGHNNGWGAVCDPTPLTPGIWYHAAITYDSVAKVMTLYKNGVQVSSATNVDNFYTGTPAGLVQLGAYDGNSNNFLGYMDEVAIWSTVLSPTDIQTIYNHQLVRH